MNSQTWGVSEVTSAFRKGENMGDQKNRKERVTRLLAEERRFGSDRCWALEQRS